MAVAAAMPTSVQTITVTADETGMRVDRFLEARFPGLSFSHIQRVIRKGEVRVNGKRTQPKQRLEAGQAVRIPPLRLDAPKPRGPANDADAKTREFLNSILCTRTTTCWCSTSRWDLRCKAAPAPRAILTACWRFCAIHTASGRGWCIASTKIPPAAFGRQDALRCRRARQDLPLPLGAQNLLGAGCWRAKGATGPHFDFSRQRGAGRQSIMRIARHGEKGASHAVTYYALVETAGPLLAWLSLKPVTGRTHQLRAHMAHIGHPIVGDPKYFSIENWELPGGMQNKLHLLARRIVVPHPRGGIVDVSAPLPPHMLQSWNLLGFDTKRYDPIVEAPEE